MNVLPCTFEALSRSYLAHSTPVMHMFDDKVLGARLWHGRSDKIGSAGLGPAGIEILIE